MKNLIDELLEISDSKIDNSVIKSFKLKDHLCPTIFDKNNNAYVMNNVIRKKLLDIANSFIDFIDVDFFVHDIILTGSLANYNWSKYSDVDLHILIDMEELYTTSSKSNIINTIVKEFFDAKKVNWNESHDVKIKGFDVEMYVQDINEKHVSTGVYSVLNNEWVVEPSQKKEDIDEKKILEKGEEFAKQIDDLVNKSKKSLDIIKDIDDVRHKLKKFRMSGLERGGEYSYENLTFKLLRRKGYIEKLYNLKNTITDKKLSLS